MEEVQSTISALHNREECMMKKPKFYVGIDISSADFTVSVGIEPWKIVLTCWDRHQFC
jgi:hypothetical protein